MRLGALAATALLPPLLGIGVSAEWIDSHVADLYEFKQAGAASVPAQCLLSACSVPALLSAECLLGACSVVCSVPPDCRVAALRRAHRHVATERLLGASVGRLPRRPPHRRRGPPQPPPHRHVVHRRGRAHNVLLPAPRGRHRSALEASSPELP